MEPLDIYINNWDYPVVLGGRRGFIIASRNGELSVPWSRYGPKIDFGGLYIPPIRATGPIIPIIEYTNGLKPLGSYVVKSEYYGSHMKTYYIIKDTNLVNTLFTPTNLPSVIITIKPGNIEEMDGLNTSTYI